MTAPLRRAHGFTWIALTILLPLLIVAALQSRKDTTPVNANVHWERLR